MTACRLKQFVFVPAGTFDNAKGLKACFLVLEKVADFSQVLTIPGKKYAFTTDLPEYEVEFWDIPEPKEKPVLLFKRKTSQLGRDLELKRESSYVDRYKFEEKTVKLGSICRINGGTYITKEELKSKPGEFLVIGGGVKPLGTYYTSNARPNSILIAKDGSAGHISTYPSEVFVSHHCSYIDNISPLFNESFLFYFLKYIKEGEIKSKKSGAAQPNITKKVIEEIEIPLFPLEKQKLIAEECAKYHDDLQGIDAKIKTLEKNVSKLGIPILSEEVCLDKICQIKIGVALTKKNIVKGPYPVIGGGCKPLGFHNSSNVKKDSILISRMGAAGHVSRYNKDLYATEVCFYLDEISPKFSPEYLYFYLKYAKEEEIKSKKYGAAQPGINRKILQNIGIENVSLEEQEEFVNYVRRRLIRKERILLSTLEEKKDLLLEMYNVFGQKCEHKIGEDTYKKSLARIRSFFHSAVNNEDIKSFLRETDYFIRQDDFEIEIEIETEEDDEELSELDE